MSLIVSDSEIYLAKSRLNVRLDQDFGPAQARLVLDMLGTGRCEFITQILVDLNQSRSGIQLPSALEFGQELGRRLSLNQIPIAVVYPCIPQNGDVGYLAIDSSISLEHSAIAQFSSPREAEYWLRGI